MVSTNEKLKILAFFPNDALSVRSLFKTLWAERYFIYVQAPTLPANKRIQYSQTFTTASYLATSYSK